MRIRSILPALLAWLRLPEPRRALSAACTLAISVVGVWIYAAYVDPVYPISDWLAWPLLSIWGYVLLCNLGWFALGTFLTRRLLGLRTLPLLESAVLSCALGVVAFTELMYLAGALALYRPWFALLLPVLLIAVGAREVVRFARRCREERLMAAPASATVLLLWAIGGALTFVIYLGVLSPDALNYDSTWCHLTTAQDYAREGRIVPFPADYNKNVPQLASIVHTWGFLVPGLTQPALRWMLALHQEFGLFLWTLAGVAAMVRRMLGDKHVAGTWTAFYLFPIIFVYDHSLGGAADHIAASFTLPGVLAGMRLLERLTWQRALAMVACMAGGMLTKLQALYWVLPLLLVVGGKLIQASWRELRKPSSPPQRRALGAIWATSALGLLLLVSPHFLRNWIFYRDPVYPLAQQIFTHAHPTVDDGIVLINNVWTDASWIPKGNAFQKAKHALELSFTFSFEPHYSFTKNFPVFGSLFTLLLPALVFIRRRGPKLLGAFVGMSTLFLWGYTYNVDRNLQIFMPLLAATTGAILLEIWRQGLASRLAIAPLVLFQLLWGADAVFYSSQERIRLAFDLIASGYSGNAKTRFDRYRSTYVALGKALPPDATVMLHTSHVNLGIDRRLVLDWAGFQGLIGYKHVHNARELYDNYRRVGITHILYTPGERPAASIQEEVVFQRLLPSLEAPVSTAGGARLQALPATPPPASHAYRVLALGLHGYGSGVFPIERLCTNEYISPDKRRYQKPTEPAPDDEAQLAALAVDAVVVGAGASLSAAQQAFLRGGFSSVAQYSGQQTIYLPQTRERTRH